MDEHGNGEMRISFGPEPGQNLPLSAVIKILPRLAELRPKEFGQAVLEVMGLRDAPVR